ncbi:LytR C-terminal domain-containing protein [Falsarthrobacter nasiphocae]|uniref:LytR/CpsA/Psr regulator C-terminal domain-containing protein n=1 Tax=Falsarthrobacter nasiphocae TaxID=189863 RepID=A0AAE4C6T0_9MICC|nr:LytR C-terminal domain-containing protein [Falsarthrobacter nasiphocae]MDR6891744.1 hypothetical protein [Falsarthrobacter nasiphocae]
MSMSDDAPRHERGAGEAWPRDSYDEIPENPRHVGAHRARFVEPAGRVGTLVVAGLCALLVGFVAAFVLPFFGFMPRASQHAVPSAAPSSASASPSPSASASTPESAAADKALRKRTVNVFNATGAEGRQRDDAAALSAKGWVIGQIGVWGQEDPGRTTVYYSGSSTKAAADLLASDLGGAATAVDKSLGKSLVVVVSPGYGAG